MENTASRDGIGESRYSAGKTHYYGMMRLVMHHA
jgi:hypothetical protein